VLAPRLNFLPPVFCWESRSVEPCVAGVRSPNGAFDAHVVQGLLELSVSYEIPDLGPAVETVAELDRLFFSGVFAFLLDALLCLMQAVVVEVHFVDVVALDVMLIHALGLNRMVLTVGFPFRLFPLLPLAVQKAPHVPVSLAAHAVHEWPRIDKLPVRKSPRNDVLRGRNASAGIRTRVDGMKTRNDGPDYTTPAVIRPPVTR
jgi:hypothetical protein